MTGQNNKLNTLQTVFGHQHFRDYQEEAIDALLGGKDLLTILPTGGGKSLIYQLPSLLMDGVTVVISPLIALMQDQVTALRMQGIKADMVSSMQSYSEIETICQLLQLGELKLLYIAPERLAAQNFLNLLQSININFFVIDEAHCVSEWGHEFRSEYRKLDRLKKLFPDIPVTAFTATATKKVEQDIIKQLNLKDPVLFRSKTFRRNLLINVQKRVTNGRKQLINFLNSHKDECGIVYTFTRNEAEETAKFLQSKHFSAKAYHAGLPSHVRSEVYHDFLHERINIVVATIAFGMGIDKSNIRFIAHTSLPKTLENYYQEIGRAGRDGLDSEVLLLYTKGDEIQKKMMMETLEDSEYKNILENKLELSYRFAISSECRHKTIAAYFDDEIEKCHTLCDNCLKGEVKKLDITVESQKFLSAVYRCDQKFGQNHIVDILRGSNNQKIHQFSHDKLSVYGIGVDLSKEKWDAITDRLFELNAITRGEHRTLNLTRIGFEILQKKRSVEIDEDKIGNIEKVISDEKEDTIDHETFEKFRKLRTQIAQKEEVPAYIVFSDKTLAELSENLPQNESDMLKINGIGKVKYEKYGHIFLELSQSFKEKKEQRPKKLTKTHFETLELIQEGKEIKEIAEFKDVRAATVLGYIELLSSHKKIDNVTKEKLYDKIREDFPKEILEWCKTGIQIEEIGKLKQFLAIYSMVYDVYS